MYTKRKDELRGRDLRYKLPEKLPLGPVVGRASPGEEVCRLVHACQRHGLPGVRHSAKYFESDCYGL